jgi:fluoroacetyl-CoA thioesterase
MAIEPGLVNEVKHTVTEADTAASHGGNKLPPVLSTPRVVGWIENTAHLAVVNLVEENQTTVGSVVNIRHLAATPVGMEVTTHAELVEVEGRRLRFKVEAWDAVEKIVDGEHERFIIDCDRFTSRLDKKRGNI